MADGQWLGLKIISEELPQPGRQLQFPFRPFAAIFFRESFDSEIFCAMVNCSLLVL
jgi:hypothetical protein